MSALKFNDTDLQKTVTVRTKIFDDGYGGVGSCLYANKTPNVCSFNLRYYDRNARRGRTVEVGVFHPDHFVTEDARREARTLLGLVSQRKDIAKAKRVRDTVAHNGTKTFEQVAVAYIEYLKTPVPKPDGGLRPRKEKWNVTVYALKRARELWARTQITDVHDTDISKLIKSMLEENVPEMARATFAQLGAMFRWAGEPDQKYIVSNPMTFLKASRLGIPSPKAKKRVLSEKEIRVLWHGLDNPNCPCDRRTALALKLILATALRPSEVGLMKREWIGKISKTNGGDGLPAVRLPEWIVKLRRVIVQPLSSLALELVDEARSNAHPLAGHNGGPALDDDDDMLFPHGRRSGEFREYGTSIKLDAHALARALRSDPKTDRVGICEFLGFTEDPIKGQNVEFSPFTPHDLRRTAASLLGFAEDEDGDPLFTEKEIDRILDHQTKDENSGNSSHETYNVAEHVNQTKRRRKTLDALDALLREVIGPKPKNNIVRINRAA